MKITDARNDGTTTVEFTAAEGRALRNVLLRLPGSPVAHQLQRLMTMVHGEALDVRPQAHPINASRED